MACVSALAAFPQGNAPITGIVVDEKGEPLIGVTVKLDGSMLGATTDLDGKFSLTIPADKKGKITLSYVGYRTLSVDVAPGANLSTLKMEPAASDIDEVVVIGYGTAKKSSLTSSVEVITHILRFIFSL